MNTYGNDQEDEARKKLSENMKRALDMYAEDEDIPPLEPDRPNRSFNSSFQKYKLGNNVPAYNFPPSDLNTFKVMKNSLSLSGVGETKHAAGDAFGMTGGKTPATIWHMKQPAEFAKTQGIKILNDRRFIYSSNGLQGLKNNFTSADRPIFVKNKQHFTIHENKLKKYDTNNRSWRDATTRDQIAPGDITDVSNWKPEELRQGLDNKLAYGNKDVSYEIDHEVDAPTDNQVDMEDEEVIDEYQAD